MSKTIAIVGSRGFEAPEEYASLILDRYPVETVVSGGARGPDRAGEAEALKRGLRVVSFRPRRQGGIYVVDRYEQGEFAETMSEPDGVPITFQSFTDAAKRRNYWIGFAAAGGVHALWDGFSGGTAHAIAAGLRTSRVTPTIWMNGDS